MGRIFTIATKLGESARLRAETEERNMPCHTPVGLAGYVAQHFRLPMNGEPNFDDAARRAFHGRETPRDVLPQCWLP